MLKTQGCYLGEDVDNKDRDRYWSFEYQKIVVCYEEQIEKLGSYHLQIDKYDIYEKVYSYICKL